MPSFKALGSKVLSNIKKRNNIEQVDGESGRSGGSDSAVDLQGDSVEAVAARAVVWLTDLTDSIMPIYGRGITD